MRQGEYARTIFMWLYFFFILCAVHVLKPVATSLFLDRFPIERLPYLYMTVAVVGGLLAYVYTKIADIRKVDTRLLIYRVICKWL